MSILKPESIRSALLKSSMINLLARGINYLRYVVIAVYLGFTFETDAFFLALSIMGIFLVAAAALETLGVPRLTRLRVEGDEKAFADLANALWTFVVLLAVGGSTFIALFSDWMAAIAFGYTQDERQVVGHFLLWLLPYFALMLVHQFLGSVLRSRRMFTVFFIAELIVAVVTLVILWSGLAWLKRGDVILPLSFVAGYLFSVLFLFWQVRRLFSLMPTWNGKVVEQLREFVPLSLVAGTYSLMPVVDRAFGSELEHKSITALTYGLLLALAANNVLRPQNFYITYLSEGRTDTAILGPLLLKVFGVGMLLALAIVVLAPWVVNLFFSYGAFSDLDGSMLTEATQLYALSLPFILIWPAMYQTMQIRQAYVVAILLGFGGVIVNGALNYVLIRKAGLEIAGITLGTLGAYVFLVVTGWWVLKYLERSGHSHRP
ncbi:lipid II flippase MurJ [Sulfurivirga sp.]|uniref:lipid II flippase MurJ n=1 Tax=Sulfurivirga sp. TaxID=2614236 RepID=UPI0025F858D5|nr:lipid II flippase MurJ [Sulfurivirga sp.]